MQYLIFIGIILAVIGILLIYFLKEPIELSDKLLMAILGTFVFKFLLDGISLVTHNLFLSAIAAIFGISTIITCGWYIKYLTDTKSKFGGKQIAVYTPLLILIVLVFIVIQYSGNDAYPGFYYRLVLAIMICLILYYFWFCIQMLLKHRKLIKEYYSGESGNITINWIVIILTLQIAEFLLKVILFLFKGVLAKYFNCSDVQIIINESCYIIETFLLVVLGIWQKSIPVFIAGIEEISSAALNADDLKRYQQKLKRFMEEQQPYLDPELTIEKLSDLTRIRKLSLSQTLNKGFNKNFFNFVKEYRIRHVQQILESRLREGAMIMDIAYECGFNSKTGFNRAFKEVTGKTPTLYLINK